MGDMTFRKAVEGLRAFHANYRAAAWQTSDGEAAEALADQALAYLEGLAAECEAAAKPSMALHMSFSHSIDDGSRNGTRSSVLSFAGEEDLLRFVEKAWLPDINPRDADLVPHECLEYGGEETMNDLNFRVGTVWRVVDGVKVSVPGLSDRIDETKKAKQCFVDTLVRRRQMMTIVQEKREEIGRLERAASQAEAFLAEHRGHLNEDGVREFERAALESAEERDRARVDLDRYVAQLPTVARRYKGFTVYPADLDNSLSILYAQEEA